MKKQDAICLLGGSVSDLAKAVGVNSQAISQWPEVLPRRLEDRVIAAFARAHLSRQLKAALAKAMKGSARTLRDDSNTENSPNRLNRTGAV